MFDNVTNDVLKPLKSPETILDEGNDNNHDVIIETVPPATVASHLDCADGREKKSFWSKMLPKSLSDDKKEESFASKKTAAEGMMDIALLTANANQLRFLLAYNTESQTYLMSVSLIIVSLILQVAVGVALIFKVSGRVFCLVES